MHAREPELLVSMVRLLLAYVGLACESTVLYVKSGQVVQVVDVPIHTRRGGAARLQPPRPSAPARAQIGLPRDDLYLPTNPRSRVLAALPESATPMQSAAKVPLLVAFQARAALAPTLP